MNKTVERKTFFEWMKELKNKEKKNFWRKVMFRIPMKLSHINKIRLTHFLSYFGFYDGYCSARSRYIDWLKTQPKDEISKI